MKPWWEYEESVPMADVRGRLIGDWPVDALNPYDLGPLSDEQPANDPTPPRTGVDHVHGK